MRSNFAYYLTDSQRKQRIKWLVKIPPFTTVVFASILSSFLAVATWLWDDCVVIALCGCASPGRFEMLFLCHEAPQFFRDCPLPPSLSGRVRSRTWIYGVAMFRSVTSRRFLCMDRHGSVVTKVTSWKSMKIGSSFILSSMNDDPIFTRESRMLRASLSSSGRLSVCLSVTLVICIKTVQARITKSSLWLPQGL